MKKQTKQIRLRLTSHMCDNISYITIADGEVNHYGKDEIRYS